MIPLIPHWLREICLRRQYRLARRKITCIEAMALPEDLKQAAITRTMRRFEERLDRFIRKD